MAKYIAVQGCTLELSSGEGIKTITSSPSSVLKCNNNGAYTKELNVSISNYTGGDIVSASGSGAGKIVASSIYTKASGESVLLEGDISDLIEITGVDSRGQPTVALITVKIAFAGQTLVKGE